MRIPCKVQISDLQPTESFVEEELTLEEAEKIVGGSGLIFVFRVLFADANGNPHPPIPPCYPNKNPPCK